MSRAKKGTVTIESVKGMLRLRLPRNIYDGNQKYFCLGLADNTQNRLIAHNKATQIEYDIALERFDYSLERYRSVYCTEKLPLFIELWDAYSEFKVREVSITTINKDYKKTRNHLLNLPSQNINNPKFIKRWLENNLTPDSAKRVLVQINACLNWAVDQDLIKINLFKDLKIFVRKKRNTINPFSKQEKEMIINFFENNNNHYANFVKFLFLTGCRPSEAIALKWCDISLESITFSHAYVEGEDKDTKTHKIRKFPINKQLSEVLNSLSKKSEQVFLSKEGCIIDGHNFLERDWKPIFSILPIKYRKVYNCRHTFITNCLEAGIPVTQVSEWVGNSSKTIWQYYAGLVTNFEVPEL